MSDEAPQLSEDRIAARATIPDHLDAIEAALCVTRSRPVLRWRYDQFCDATMDVAASTGAYAMTPSKHTPGPWFVDGLHMSAIIHDSGGRVWRRIAETDTPAFPNSNWRADARLIAAAPELLAALRYVVSQTELLHGLAHVTGAAREAIARADGKMGGHEGL